MNKYYYLFLFLIAFSIPSSMQAQTNQPVQQDEEVEFIIEDDTEITGKSSWEMFKNYWDKHLKLLFGTSVSYYTTGYRTYVYSSLTFEENFWDWMYTKISGEISRKDIRIDLEDQINTPCLQ